MPLAPSADAPSADTSAVTVAEVADGRVPARGGGRVRRLAALLLSGLVSSGVGTRAGQVIMAGFLRRRVPLWVRRTVTLCPALLLLGLGADPTVVLVVSALS
ncbi:hypothetical protein Acsp06_15390 [Actinomycetospora sp. NBRC 106375]|uniref:divalent metal cation transporter n=1 Tax=Actinomycetospora sp. NBRC 106375 TaxID=3032207 RepID=UPI0024A17D03|nr:divalent metal cation transporter [Actinomycetospora sp. NBRC 106375]GLZ45354.1 hypothetical protein Acsp06_15390 [Actinomycetospora sp. NBRC 106375]